MNELPRRKAVATYGKAQRKRKSNELFADLEDFSPRRRLVPQSLSTTPEADIGHKVGASPKARQAVTKSPGRKTTRFEDVELDLDEGRQVEIDARPSKARKGSAKAGQARREVDEFDMPSSGDETTKRRKPNGTTNGTKREAVVKTEKQSTGLKKTLDAVYDDVFDLPSSDEERPRKRKPQAFTKAEKLSRPVPKMAPAHPIETHDFRKTASVVTKEIVSEVILTKQTAKQKVTVKASTIHTSITNGTVAKAPRGTRSRSTTPALVPAITTRQTRSRSTTPAVLESDAQQNAPAVRIKPKAAPLEATKKSAAAIARLADGGRIAAHSTTSALPKTKNMAPGNSTNRTASKRAAEAALELNNKRRSVSPKKNRVSKIRDVVSGKSPAKPRKHSPKALQERQQEVEAQLMDFDDAAEDDLINESMLLADETFFGTQEITTAAPTFTSTPQKGRHRTRDKSASPVTQNTFLADLLGDLKPTEPPKRRRLIDSLNVGANYVPKPQLSDEGGSILEEELKQSHATGREKPPAYDAVMEIADSQESQGDSQQSLGHSQPRDHLLSTRGGPKNTYLRQRSYLTEEMTGEDAFKTPLLLVPPTVRKAQPVFDEGLEDDGPKKGGLKSKHELREAGGSKRFLDDMEGYMEDLEGTELRSKRMGFMELANKMGDDKPTEKAFVRKFRANNLDQRYLAKMDQHEDEIIQFCIAYSLCIFLLEDTTGRTVTQIRQDGAIPMLLEMLNSDRDIVKVAKDKLLRLSNLTQTLVLDLRRKVAASSCFAEHKITAVSGRLLALKVIEQILQIVKEAGFEDDIVANFDANSFVELMEPFTGANSPPPEVDLLFLVLPLSILEILTTQNNSGGNARIKPAYLQVLVTFLPKTMKWTGGDSEDMREKTRVIQSLALRLIINLTNLPDGVSSMLAAQANTMALIVEVICDKFRILASPGNVGWDDVQMEERDILILTLGLLMNVAEQCDEAREAVVQERVGVDTALGALVEVYVRKSRDAEQAESAEEAETNVAFGYLAVALAHLCQNVNARRVVRSKLSDKTLKPLSATLEEFINHHRRIDGELGQEMESGLTVRLEKAAEDLRLFI